MTNKMTNLEQIIARQEEIKQLIKYPVKYDGINYFFDADNNMIAEIRGFGRLDDKIDNVAQFIVEAINEKLTSSSIKEILEGVKLKISKRLKKIPKDCGKDCYCKYCEKEHDYNKELGKIIADINKVKSIIK